MPRGKRCIAHVHTYVTSEENHHLQPQSRGGPTRADNLVWLCANAHGDVHFYLDLIEHHRGVKVPWEIAQHYSPAVRRIAVRGWTRYAEDFLVGKYAAHSLLWSTSGQPRPGLVYPLSYNTAARWNDADAMLARARAQLAGRNEAFTL